MCLNTTEQKGVSSTAAILDTQPHTPYEPSPGEPLLPSTFFHSESQSLSSSSKKAFTATNHWGHKCCANANSSADACVNQCLGSVREANKGFADKQRKADDTGQELPV